MVYDFGKTSRVEVVTGVFKFKNVGDGVLTLEQPKPSCGCTTAELKPDSLKPGESGELPFTLNLGHSKAVLEKHITVKSNDPKTPEVSLTIRADYTPLYEVEPLTLAPVLPFGVASTNVTTTIKRTDGKPLKIVRMDASKPWITAKLDPGLKSDPSSATIRVEVTRDGSPRRFNEYVHIYAEGETNTPVSSIYVYGQVSGEITMTPEAFYWSITDTSKTPADRTDAMITRRLKIRSSTGKTFQLTNAISTIKGMQVEIVALEPGKVYELVAKLYEDPEKTVAGTISFDTSVAAQPKIEVQCMVNVFKP
jgi:hypothetical protein